MTDTSKQSDMFVQYKAIKKQYSDAVLLFRLGDFYELFNEDAVEISKVLDLTLTSKSCGNNEKAPMCGIPYHAVEGYINKLISKGYKVAICEQMQQAGAGVKLVRRDVVRVITPGTVMDEGILEETKNNYICSIFNSGNIVGVAYCELSTGEFGVLEFENNYIDLLNDFLVRLMPSEIICKADVDLQALLPCSRGGLVPNFIGYDEFKFSTNFSREILTKYFGIDYENKYDVKNKTLAQRASGALLGYLEETQKRSLGHINNLIVEKYSNYMQLDISTRRNLEILETLKDHRKKGSLISIIDKTSTAMGSRLLKKWICEPLYNEKLINERLSAVEELVTKLIERDKISNILNNISDIERINGRIAYGNFTPKDAKTLRNSLLYVPQLKQILFSMSNPLFKNFAESIPDFSRICKLLFDAISDDAPAILSNGNVIKSGFNSDLDNLRLIKTNTQDYILKLEQEEREESGIDSLKISYNKVIGYFIEVDTQYANDVPLRYMRKQTVSSKDRYITAELKEYQENIDNADENALKLEKNIFNQIRELLLKDYCRSLQTVSNIVAVVDCLMSLTQVAVKNGYNKPKVSSKFNHIYIEDGRHPVVEVLNKDDMFIPNNTLLDNKENKIMILTGPNMAGKSTYMRQVAIITLLSHIGSFVPAKKAEIALTDRIFTRVGASDDLAVGQSTFMVEMMEVANILKNATKNSLVILDEIGRGTSTFDGLSIAWATVEQIANNMDCKTMFSTHYHELTELEGLLSGVKNFKIAIKELNGKLVYLRKIQRGGANRSYGIEVASLAGVPENVISRAKQISNELEKNDLSKHVLDLSPDKSEIVQSQNKTHLEVIDILKELDINKITPLGAFETLLDLIEKVKGK